MEHLIHNFNQEELEYAMEATADAEVLLVRDWDAWEDLVGVCPPVQPVTPWLNGFSADMTDDRIASDAFKSEAFGLIDVNRGWTIMAIYRTGNIRDAHPSFAANPLYDEDIEFLCATFLQRWFYLALLQFILVKRVEPSYLVRLTDRGVPIVDSRNLVLALGGWSRCLRRYSDRRRSQALEFAMKCCEDVQYKLKWLMYPTGLAFDRSHFKRFTKAMSSIAPSILLLIEALGDAMSPWIGGQMKYPLEHKVFAQRNQRLTSRGWCPSVVARLSRRHSASLLCFVDVKELRNSSTEHVSCSTSACSNDNVDTDQYVPKHLKPNCRCGKVKPDLLQVAECIEHGFIPVLELKSSMLRPKFRITAHSRSDPAKYIAISHCWADGLGGSTENGVYLCQAKRIQQLANQFPAVQGFWIDSACVPKDIRWRRKAIISMAQVYRDAVAVVVLDSSIGQASRQDEDLTLCWRIIASPWNRRLWTYQESVNAAALYFELKDGLTTFDTVTAQSMRSNTKMSRTFSDLASSMHDLQPRGVWRASGGVLASVVLNQLSQRTTSKPTDELLAIVGLLDIDVAELIDLQGDERMIKFAKLARKLPWSLVFMKKSQEDRIQTKPFRWLPKSFLGWTSGGVEELDLDPGNAGICTEHGLEITLEILELESPMWTHWPKVRVRANSLDYYLFRIPDLAPNSLREQASAVLVYQNGGPNGIPSKLMENLSAEPARLLSFALDDQRAATCHFQPEFRLQRDDFIEWAGPMINGRWVRRTIVIT